MNIATVNGILLYHILYMGVFLKPLSRGLPFRWQANEHHMLHLRGNILDDQVEKLWDIWAKSIISVASKRHVHGLFEREG